MPFKPGESGNKSGRPKGSRNKTSAEVADRLLQLLDSRIDELYEDIAALEPKERANLLINLAKHVTPAALNPEKLTIEQLQQVADYMKDKYKSDE
jgi:hypothetical protein